jgi:hypothetical protein
MRGAIASRNARWAAVRVTRVLDQRDD